MKVEEFLNPSSMLTPGIVGSMIMMLTNTIAYNFEMPHKWVGLALSFTVGLLLVIRETLPIWQRCIYYVFNSLIIFSMAVGAANITVSASSATSQKDAASSQQKSTQSSVQPASRGSRESNV